MNSRRILASLAGGVVLAVAPTQANITFNLMPESGTSQTAIDGFVAAGNLWSAVLADNITVNIQIGFSELGPGIIGQAGSAGDNWSYTLVKAALLSRATSVDDFSSFAGLQLGTSYSRIINHTSDNPNGPNSATPYVDSMNVVGLTSANAKALGLLGPNSSVDAVIRFNSTFNFDFNPNDGITPGQLDFVGAAAHEIGHALGFTSGVDDIDDLGGTEPGNNFSSNLIDLFRYSTLSLSMGPGFTDYTADTRTKFFSVDGGTNQVAPFSTGVNYGDGRQASHWKDNQGIGIMDPTAANGELLSISAIDLRAMDVIGYTVAVPEPGTMALCGVGLALAMGWRGRRKV